MRRRLILLVLICLLLYSVSVYADIPSQSEKDFSTTQEGEILDYPIYDADDLANYIKHNLKNNSVEMIVGKYFSILSKSRNYNNRSVDMINTKDIGEKLKVIKIDDNMKITFYKNGMFVIERVEHEKKYNPVKMDIMQPNSIPWEEDKKTNTAEFYNGLGIRYVTLTVSCRYKYNGSEIKTIGNPTGSVDVNKVVCSLVEKSSKKFYIEGVLDVYTQCYS